MPRKTHIHIITFSWYTTYPYFTLTHRPSAGIICLQSTSTYRVYIIIIVIIVTVEAAVINATSEDDFRTAAATLPRRPSLSLLCTSGRRLAVRSYSYIRTRKPEHFIACVESRVNQSGGGENNTRSLELIVLRCIYIYIYIYIQIRGGDDVNSGGGGYMHASWLHGGETSRKWNR